MIIAQGALTNGHTIMPAPGLKDTAPLRMKMPQAPQLPPGLTAEDFAQLPPEQQLIIQ